MSRENNRNTPELSFDEETGEFVQQNVYQRNVIKIPGLAESIKNTQPVHPGTIIITAVLC